MGRRLTGRRWLKKRFVSLIAEHTCQVGSCGGLTTRLAFNSSPSHLQDNDAHERLIRTEDEVYGNTHLPFFPHGPTQQFSFGQNVKGKF